MVCRKCNKSSSFLGGGGGGDAVVNLSYKQSFSKLEKEKEMETSAK